MVERAVFFVAMALAGCAIAPRAVPSKLYNVKDAQVLDASFIWEGKQNGPVAITKADETCTGEYRSIVEGRDTVGAGSSLGPWGVLFGTVGSSTTIERAQRGYAVAICPSKQAFECEYITNVSFSGVTGHGACKDNRGATYRLMF